MLNVIRYQLQPYGIAVLTVASALLLTLLLQPLLEPTVFVLFFPTVMVSALYGGTKSGVLASILSALACQYFFLTPAYSLTIPDWGTAVRLVVFLFVMLLIATMSSALRTAKQRTELSLLKLKASEERYRVLAENVPQLVWITRADGFVEYCNQRWFDYTGLTLNETLGWDWQQTVHPDDLSFTLEQWKTGLATGNPVDVQYRVKRADGIYRWHIIRAVPLRNSSGEIVNWLGTCTDIHDQKQAEAVVYQREQEFRALAENSPDIIARIDKALRHVYVNPAIEKATGLSPEDFIGKTHRDLGFPEEICADWQTRLQQMFVTRQPSSLEFEFAAPDGIRYYQSRIVPEFGEEGSVVSVLGISHDVTDYKRAEQALRQSESRFRRVVESNMIGIGVWNRDGKIMEANDALLQIVGYTQADLQAQGLHWRQLTPPEYQALDEKALKELETCEICNLFEKEYIHKNGKRIPILVGAARFEDTPDRGVFFVLDLTERKQAEQERIQLLEALESKQRLLEAVLQQMPAGLVVAEAPSGRLVLMNQQVQQMLHGSFPLVGRVEDYLQYEMFYPDGRLYAPEEIPLARSLTTGEVVRGEEITIVCGDRTRRTFLADSSPIRNAEGEIVAGVVTFYDITEQKRAQERIQLYADVVKNAQVGLSVWQLEDLENPGSFRLITSNPAASQFIGIPLEELIGTTIAESFPTLLGTQLLSDYVDVVRTGQAKDLGEVRYSDEQISEAFFWLKAFPLPDRCIGFAFENITERKKVEQVLRNALQKLNFHVENTPLAVIERDRDFRITRWSQGAERIFGWSAQEVIGKGIHEWQAIVAEDIEIVRNARERLLSGQEKQNIVSNRSYRKDGSVVYCEWYNSALLDESGNLVSVLSLVLDVTDRKQAEVERLKLLERERAARTEAEAANRIKDEFLAVLSHELRSPLNPILGWSKLLQSRNVDEATLARGLETIERNAKLQIQLIEDLLDVSRILRGKLTLTICPVDLVSTIEAALETVRLAASAKSIQIETLYQPNVGQVLGDSGRLQQVVWNLVSNAVKFTPSGGRVDVQLSKVERLEGLEDNLQPATSYAQIQVSDTGKGINPDFLPHVFDYFRQENSTTTRAFGGLGLGLAIVRHLVELHGGAVSAESLGEGQGATFTVWLPLKVTLVETKLDNQQDNDSPDLSGIRVLVVDDEVDMREFLSFMLEDYGAEVTVVTSASEALEALREVEPDVLVSDIGMPDVDGYTLIRQIRAMPPEQGGQIPAIALTAYAAEADQTQALSSGFTKHIAKPVEPNALATVVASLARRNINGL